MGVTVDLFKTDLAGLNRRELVTPSVDQVKWTLNGHGGATISEDPLAPDAAFLIPDEVELQIWLNGTYSQCVIPRGVGGNTDRLTFECQGLTSEFESAYFALPPRQRSSSRRDCSASVDCAGPA